MFAVLLDGNEQVERSLAQDRYVYVHVARGDVALNDTPHAGDGAMLADGERVMLAQGRNAEVLVFERRKEGVARLPAKRVAAG